MYRQQTLSASYWINNQNPIIAHWPLLLVWKFEHNQPVICSITQPDSYLFRSVTTVPEEYWYKIFTDTQPLHFLKCDKNCKPRGLFWEKVKHLCFNDNWIFSLASGKSFENCLPWQIKVDNILYKTCYHNALYICKLADYWPDAKMTFSKAMNNSFFSSIVNVENLVKMLLMTTALCSTNQQAS